MSFKESSGILNVFHDVFQTSFNVFQIRQAQSHARGRISHKRKRQHLWCYFHDWCWCCLVRHRPCTHHVRRVGRTSGREFRLESHSPRSPQGSFWKPKAPYKKRCGQSSSGKVQTPCLKMVTIKKRSARSASTQPDRPTLPDPTDRPDRPDPIRPIHPTPNQPDRTD